MSADLTVDRFRSMGIRGRGSRVGIDPDEIGGNPPTPSFQLERTSRGTGEENEYRAVHNETFIYLSLQPKPY